MAVGYFKIDSQDDSNRFLFFCVAATAVSVISQTALILIYFGKLPPQVPLYFGRTWGESILGSPKELWILPGSLCLIFAINWVLSKTLRANSPFLVNVLTTFTLIFSMCSLLATLKIITLVA